MLERLTRGDATMQTADSDRGYCAILFNQEITKPVRDWAERLRKTTTDEGRGARRHCLGDAACASVF